MEQAAEASTSRGAAQSKRSRRIYDVQDRTTKTDVGSNPGTSWTLSSYKPGSGVSELRSPDLTKLWQSDGNQPHLINIQFARRTCVTHLSIYLDVKQDDSYTPTKIAVKAGTNHHDLTLVRQRAFDTPQGWKHFNMTPGSVDAVTNEEEEEAELDGEAEGAAGTKPSVGTGADDDEEGEEEGEGEGSEGIRVWLLQVCILANHLNGKDTHIRRLVVFGPRSRDGQGGSSEGLKRSLVNGVVMPRAKSRLAPSSGTGRDVTLAQLLAIQSAAEQDQDTVGEDGQGSFGSNAPRSRLNVFGNIR